MEYHNDITMKPSSLVYLIYTFKMQILSSQRNKPRYLVKKVVCISPFYNLQNQMKIMTATQECIVQDIITNGFIESVL